MAHQLQVSFLFFLCSINLAANEVFHITTTSTSPELCTDPCSTLSEFAANLRHYLYSNITLIFLPGIHYLTVSMSISNTESFSMSSESTTSQVVCRNSSHIHFSNSQHIGLSNLEFIQCGGNQVKHVEEFIVEDTKFNGQNVGGTALEIIEIVSQIINSTFEFNRKGELKNLIVSIGLRFVMTKDGLAGGAIIATGCRVAISQSKFENNGAEYGGAIFAQQSSIIIIRNSTFTICSALFGGALFSLRSIIIIEGSEFDINGAKDEGGALYSFESFIKIKASKFNGNTAISGSSLRGGGGGVLYSFNSTIIIDRGQFNDNTAISESTSVEGGGGVLFSMESTIIIRESEFDDNSATSSFREVGGGVLYSFRSTITILKMSEFDGNSATNSKQSTGGVLHSNQSTITIKASKFSSNTAVSGGVLYSNNCTIMIVASSFINNSANSRTRPGILNFAIPRGGVMYFKSSIIAIDSASECDGNTARFEGGVLFSQNSTITIEAESTATRHYDNTGNHYIGAAMIMHMNDSLQIVNNVAEYAVIYLSDSEFNVNYSGNLILSNNMGSLLAFNSNITFMGYIVFVNNHPQQSISTSGTLLEGGALTLFQSNAYFNGKSIFLHNYAKDGGGLLSAESRVYVKGDIIIAHNVAIRNGGGVYLSNSALTCLRESTFLLNNNIAGRKGGGLHAVSSTIKVTSAYSQNTKKYTGTRLNFTKNVAEMGGGLSLEANAKLYILKYDLVTLTDTYSVNTTVFTANSALLHGGAMYVNDNTNSGKCSSSSKTECFLQVLAVYTGQRNSYLTAQTIYFSHNRANISGSTLYGGLLDRCTVSQFAEIQYIDREYFKAGGVSYFKNISIPMYIKHYIIDEFTEGEKKVSIATNLSISSDPVKVCLCINNEHNCSHQAHIEIKKGEAFNISLVAVNQVEHPVVATIHASLLFPQSGLSEGQLTSEIQGECTDLTFNVVSRHKHETLILYALDGPCKDADLSRRVIGINFRPCSCPIGFQISGKFEINCTCDCHNNISQYVEHCDSHTGTFVKNPQSRSWISYINDTNLTGYLVYPNCPFDYCYSNLLSLPIDLSLSDGANAQCAFNRSSLLCGSCQSDLTLSLGSSRCLQCPSYWPVHLIAITIVAILAGIALVALLLVLNMTISVGSLNGLIFYANIVYANKSILLPYQKINLITVIISWMNLELGIDTCYFPRMDAYVKTWLRLVFPVYIIILVVLIIMISSYSMRFSKLIGKKDPVTTLATLILLSYAKVLEICFKSLSVGILKYPDGTNKRLWLPDATVKYLSGKHIPLFLSAILILLIGLVYTALLFLWQWLLCLPDWKIFKWTRDQKLQEFIETHHIPFTPKHRYWTGLLLIARAVLYLVAAVNVSNDPQLALSAIIFTVSCILLLRSCLQSKVYRKLPVNILETIFLFNLLFFSIFTWYSLSNADINQEAVAYVSVLIALFALLLIILCHIYTYTTVFLIVKKSRPFRIIHAFFARNDQELRRPQSLPPDDDIHRFNELLDIIDHPVNTDDYRVPLLMQKPVEPTQTVVEVHQPYIPPPEPEQATSQNIANQISGDQRI